MLNLRQLETFREVMRAGTTTGAAKALRISQPAVSNAIKQMEQQIGMTLFERVGNRLVPTPEAQEMFRDSESIFSLYHAFSHRIEGLRLAELGSLRIVATPPLVNALVPGVLKEFLHTRPGVRVSVDTRRIDGVIEAVETRSADIGFALSPPDRETVTLDHIATAQMVCGFPPGHPLEDRVAVTADDIARYPIVLYEPKSRLNLVLQRSFLRPDLHLNIVAEVRYSSIACLLAEAGLGITIVDSLTGIAGNRYNLVFRPLFPTQPVRAYAIYRKDETQKRVLKAFLSDLRRSPVVRQIQEYGL
jgi:DNA-binding transcriptional LysR family regulator